MFDHLAAGLDHQRVGGRVQVQQRVGLRVPVPLPEQAGQDRQVLLEGTDPPLERVPERRVLDHLVASPDVQVVSYTGSIAVGRIVARDGAATLKRMNLELGGKTPMIVFDDADLDLAVPMIASALTTRPSRRTPARGTPASR